MCVLLADMASRFLPLGKEVSLIAMRVHKAGAVPWGKSAKKLCLPYAKVRGRQNAAAEVQCHAPQPEQPRLLASTGTCICCRISSHISSRRRLWKSHISSQAINLTCHVMSHRRHMLASAQAGSLLICSPPPQARQGWRQVPKIPGTYSVPWTHLTLVP